VRAALAGDAGQKPGLGSGLLFGLFGKRKTIRLASVGRVFLFSSVKRASDAKKKSRLLFACRKIERRAADTLASD
jgi:hypothetical protein